MKKNTILLVIDSLYYDKTIGQSYRNPPMPFLDELRKKSINCTNMYSEAPYTEAALVSLLCGKDTLKSGGYLKKLADKETIMETFKKEGYTTFCNCVQPLVYPTKSYPGITDEYYNICYEFGALWSYRLYFYSEKYKNNLLDEKYLTLIQELVEDNLITWRNFYQNIKNKDKNVSFIMPYMDINDLDKNIDELEEEYIKYQDNPTEYVKELLTKGTEHQLFKLHQYNLNKKMNPKIMKEVNRRYKSIIRKIYWKNVYLNLRNNRLVLHPKEERKSLIKSYINAVFNRFLYEKIDYRIASKKAAPSMYTTIKHFESWVLQQPEDNPYFAYIHVDDCHRQEFFYTYDTNDLNQLDKEFNDIKDFLKKMPKNYKGNISYDLSLQYADNCIKELYQFLDKNNLLDNVNIAICADHGYSYSFAPYRSNYVNNVHHENYHMPFVLWSKDIKPQKNEYFHNSKDIPATILELSNISIPKNYDGKSILKGKGRDYVILENVPGGCPDYNLRNILLGIRNHKFLIVMELNLNKEFTDGSIHSVYDLTKDKEELYNLKDTIDRKDIQKYLDIIEKEFYLLKEDKEKNNFLKME